ncbi:hypothetical protein [Streptacidiphilus albus]|uniref:hypothetical protein n=1 Tax=Streptacidiphilus albus TaxID=105425 RepID=UPI00054B7AD3|nr:hypothetical protein [Streptacidiphilus albus]
MNVSDLLRHLQAEQDQAAAHTEDLQRQIDDLTAALVEARAHLTELQTTSKVIDGIISPGAEPRPAPDTYQRLVAHFNDHPRQSFRARELHELLDLPTDEASVNTTRSRLGRLVRQGVLTQPGRGIYQKRT